MSNQESASAAMTPPYDESRRLTGPNLYFASPGAALETVATHPPTAVALQRWRENITALRAALGWADAAVQVREHARGASLAFAAPIDQLYTAVAGNEWAWCAALGLPVVSDLQALDGIDNPQLALAILRREAAAEAIAQLTALQQAAAAHRLPILIDEDLLTLGMGRGAQSWPLDALPDIAAIDFARLHAIPTALITGSNGKTTTTRVLSAMLRAHGWPTACSSTEGVFFDGVLLEAGDYSGPAGARAALRQPTAEAAVLETARGGLLRRGMALAAADVAVVTNISPDHFGEYGIHDLDGLAEVKLVVAQAVRERGLLVLNADDERLRRFGPPKAGRIGWFAADYDAPLLADHRRQGGATAGVRAGRLWLSDGTHAHDLGAVAAMPLTLAGHAVYHIANLAAAALAAQAMAVPAATIADVAARFGADLADNPGRLQAWQLGGLRLVVDYAHNVDGLHGSINALLAGSDGYGRFGSLLGHAGNRDNQDYANLAGVLARFKPDHVVLKETDGYERGRQPGEVPALLRQGLLAHGVDADRIIEIADETEAATALLAWARDGDRLFLQLLTPAARERMMARLQRLIGDNWRPGQALPDFDDGASDDE